MKYGKETYVAEKGLSPCCMQRYYNHTGKFCEQGFTGEFNGEDDFEFFYEKASKLPTFEVAGYIADEYYEFLIDTQLDFLPDFDCEEYAFAYEIDKCPSKSKAFREYLYSGTAAYMAMNSHYELSLEVYRSNYTVIFFILDDYITDLFA